MGVFHGAALALTALAAGCHTPPPSNPPPPSVFRSGSSAERPQATIDPTQVETRDDIFQIIRFWVEPIWLQRHDRIVGFKVTVYFLSAETGLGAFVSGDIYVWVYELVPTRDGRWERKLTHMWRFDEAEALGYRVRIRSIQGYHYGFPLVWPADLALEGRRIEIELGYERADKRVILSEPKEFRVPVPAGYRRPAKETER
jgi:hypothetical protein